MSQCSKKTTLTVTTSVFACASFACLCIAVSTDYWLHAIERITGTGTPEPTNPKIPLKRTSSGLWRKCVEFVVQEYANMSITRINVTCNYISYFQPEDKDKNELGPTDAILLSLRTSTIFPLLSLLLLLIGEIVCLMSHCDRKKNMLIFLSGILFVIAGLFTLIGLILYIGAITEEAGNKSKSASSSPTDPPRFQYSYGSSFILTILSFTAAELTGVLSVYLYISRHKHSYRKKVERLQSPPQSTLSAAAAAADGGSPATAAAAATIHLHHHHHHHHHQQQQQQQPNNIDAAAPPALPPPHLLLNPLSSSSSPRPNGRATVALDNGSPSTMHRVGMATATGAAAVARGNAAAAADAVYALARMTAARSACDVRGSRETLESDGLMAPCSREPSRYTLSLGAVDPTRTPNHQRYPLAVAAAAPTTTTTADSYRRTTPV